MIAAVVVLSALLHAGWNALLRLEREKDFALVAAVGVATVIAMIVAGVRWAGGEAPFVGGADVAWAVAAGVLEVVYFASLARALERGSLGAVYTISRGGALVVVWPASVLLLGEVATIGGIAGTVIVFGGIALSGWRAGERSDGAGLGWAVACAVSIAGYHLAYKAALEAGGSGSAVFALALGVATVVNVGRVGVTRPWAVMRGRVLRVVVMGALCGGSFLLLMEALAVGGGGFVLTLRNTSVLFAIGIAWAIGDRPRRAQVIGAILVAAGAVLMAW